MCKGPMNVHDAYCVVALELHDCRISHCFKFACVAFLCINAILPVSLTVARNIWAFSYIQGLWINHVYLLALIC